MCIHVLVTVILIVGWLKMASHCFTEFIEGVSQFSVKGDKEMKLRCKYNAN